MTDQQSDTDSRTGAQLVVDCLVGLGATHAFGVPGESYLAVLDALHDTRGRLDFVNTRNEGGAGFMAAAWGKLTGRPGIALVTRGPGATNAAIGVHTAMQDSSPMLLFIGQIETGMRGREAFQEIDYRAFFAPIAKWAVEIDDAARVPEILSRAWTTAVSGRPGPVVVALPEDMLAARTTARPLARPLHVRPPHPSADTMDEVAALIAAADRPLIVLGGGSLSKHGGADLQGFAEAADIPLVVAFRSQDRVDTRSRVYCGDAGFGMAAGVKRLIREADLILAVGIRFGETVTDGYTLLDVPVARQKIVHVHVSDREIGKIYAPELAIHADPDAFAAALRQRTVTGHWADWRHGARAAHEAALVPPPQPGAFDMGAAMRHLADVLPEDAILTNGAGNFAIWPGRYFPFGPRHRYLAPQSGAMGYGLPAAIAARIAHPERTVVCFAGDGDFQMNGQELATARQAGACPIVLILNNGTYGTIRMHQERHFPERVSGTDLWNPDFAAFARAYGVHGETVTRTEDFPAALARALASATGAVLDLRIDAEGLSPRETITSIRSAARGA